MALNSLEFKVPSFPENMVGLYSSIVHSRHVATIDFGKTGGAKSKQNNMYKREVSKQ